MFQPTYGTFGCPCCANETHFFHLNSLLRRQLKSAEDDVQSLVASCVSLRQRAAKLERGNEYS